MLYNGIMVLQCPYQPNPPPPPPSSKKTLAWYIKKITSKWDPKHHECEQRTSRDTSIPNLAIIGNCRLRNGQGHHSLKRGRWWNTYPGAPPTTHRLVGTHDLLVCSRVSCLYYYRQVRSRFKHGSKSLPQSFLVIMYTNWLETWPKMKFKSVPRKLPGLGIRIWTF